MGLKGWAAVTILIALISILYAVFDLFHLSYKVILSIKDPLSPPEIIAAEVVLKYLVLLSAVCALTAVRYKEAHLLWLLMTIKVVEYVYAFGKLVVFRAEIINLVKKKYRKRLRTIGVPDDMDEGMFFLILSFLAGISFLVLLAILYALWKCHNQLRKVEATSSAPGEHKRNKRYVPPWNPHLNPGYV
uniref:Uncharacterized protein n=1 Tax=Steinernema glaseri TaxID=37863 RepID=A0A1I7YAT1_9BILA